jgi:hypothetical protein
MLGAISRYSPGDDFPPFRGEHSEGFEIFIVDRKAAVGAKPANLSAVV